MSASGDAPHRWPVRVYYEDTDFSGVVYHANYLRFLERGRTEFLRHLGIDQSVLHDARDTEPMAFAVRDMTLSFMAAARMDDLLVVETRIDTVGGASVTMAQAVLRSETRLVAATVRVALVAGGRARRLPQSLSGRLRAGLQPNPPSGTEW